MEYFNETYNKLLKGERKNEAVFKSRLKKKFQSFIDGENDDPLCILIKAYLEKIKNVQISIKPKKEDKPEDIVDHLDDKDIVIRDHEIKIEEQSIKIISLEKTVKKQEKTILRLNNTVKKLEQKINVMEHKHEKDMNEMREKFKNLENRNEVLVKENKVMRHKLGNVYGDEDYME